jgi:hypothetical protein
MARAGLKALSDLRRRVSRREAVQRVCYALEAAVRSPLLFRFRAGFHCQIVDVVGRSHSRRNQGAAAVLAPGKTPVLSSWAVSSLRASSPLKKLQFALNGHGPPSCVRSASRIAEFYGIAPL